VFVARSVLGRDGSTVIRRLLLWSAAALAAGAAMAFAVPVVKQIWTPSYALVGLGFSCALLAALHWFIAERGHRRWTKPLVDLGTNPIAIYVAVSVLAVVVFDPIRQRTVPPVAGVVGAAGASVLYAVGVAALGWALAVELRRHHLFLRV